MAMMIKVQSRGEWLAGSSQTNRDSNPCSYTLQLCKLQITFSHLKNGDSSTQLMVCPMSRVSARNVFFTTISKVIIIFTCMILLLDHLITVLQFPSPPASTKLSPSVLPQTFFAPLASKYAPEHYSDKLFSWLSLQQAITTSPFQCHIVKKGSLCLLGLWTRLIIQSYISYTSVPMFSFSLNPIF